jgi:hypothetical protein
MCWSAPVSFLTWTFSTICSVYLWKRNWTNDRTNAVFAASFAIVQLLEGFIWLDIDSSQGVNQVCTLAIRPVLYIEASSLILGHFMEHGTSSSQALLFQGVGITSAVAVALRLATDLSKTVLDTTSVGAGGHLVWPALETIDLLFLMFVFPLGMSFPILRYLPRAQGYVYSATGPFSILLTFFWHADWEYPSTTLKGEFGTVWCHIANVYGIVCIAIPLVMPGTVKHQPRKATRTYVESISQKMSDDYF